MPQLAINALLALALSVVLVFAGGLLAWGHYSPHGIHYLSVALVLPFVVAAKAGVSGIAGNILAFAIYFALSFVFITYVRRPRETSARR